MTVKNFIKENPLTNISIYRHNEQINEWEHNAKIQNAEITNIDSDPFTGEVFIDID